MEFLDTKSCVYRREKKERKLPFPYQTFNPPPKNSNLVKTSISRQRQPSRFLSHSESPDTLESRKNRKSNLVSSNPTRKRERERERLRPLKRSLDLPRNSLHTRTRVVSEYALVRFLSHSFFLVATALHRRRRREPIRNHIKSVSALPVKTPI